MHCKNHNLETVSFGDSKQNSTRLLRSHDGQQVVGTSYMKLLRSHDGQQVVGTCHMKLLWSCDCLFSNGLPTFFFTTLHVSKCIASTIIICSKYEH